MVKLGAHERDGAAAGADERVTAGGHGDAADPLIPSYTRSRVIEQHDSQERASSGREYKFRGAAC